MPMLMEKKDWLKTVSSLAMQDRVWQEDVCGDTGVVSLSLPELGRYRVFLVKMTPSPKPGRIKIGSMKDEIRLPDNFDQEFEVLDDQVASMFTGVAS